MPIRRNAVPVASLASSERPRSNNRSGKTVGLESFAARVVRAKRDVLSFRTTPPAASSCSLKATGEFFAQTPKMILEIGNRGQVVIERCFRTNGFRLTPGIDDAGVFTAGAPDQGGAVVAKLADRSRGRERLQLAEPGDARA